MAINFGDLGKQLNSGVGQFTSQIQSGLGQLNTITQQVSNISNEFNALLGSTQTILNIPTKLLQDPLNAVSSELDVALNANLNKFQQTINDTISQLDPALSFNLSNITSVSTEVATGINQIASQINGSIDDFVSNLGSVSNQITDNFSGQFGQLSGALSNVTQGLTGFTSAIPNFTQQLSDALPKLPADFGKISQSVGNFNNQLQAVSGKISGAIESASAFTNPGQFLQTTIDNAIGAGLERVLGVIGNITNFGALLSNLVPGSNRAVSVLSDVFETISTTLSGERLTTYEESIKNVFDNSDVSLLSSGALLSGNINSSNTLSIQNFNSRSSNNKPFSSSRIPNPLRNHNTYNYIVTLGCISSTAYNTGTYKDSGLDRIILRSGGGSKSQNRVRTAEEQSLGEDLEYFIDDLEIDAVIAPNQNTGISLGTTIKFKVVEPYSMSQFIEALQVAANESGYTNYINATFCLKIEFVGWDELGKTSKQFVEKPIYIPIKLIKMDFDVTESGSQYIVDAISYGEMSTFDHVNNTLVQIGTNGFSVADVLENANNAVTAIMNDHLEVLENDGRIPKMHRYLILFPKDVTSIYDIVKTSGDVDVSKLTSDPITVETKEVGPGLKKIETTNRTLVEDFIGAPPIYRKLKYYSLSEANMNSIGLSPLKVSTVEGGNQSFTLASSAIRDGRIYRNTKDLEPTQNSRRFDYNEGNRITGIIEDVILSSRYVQDALEKIRNNQPGENGKYAWFRIEPMTFVEQTGEIENESGATVNTYVYAIHEYFIDEAKFIGPGGTPSGTEALRKGAPKEYSYFYTGQNEDVLNFDINFNMAFFNAISGDLNSGRTGGGSHVTGEVSETGDATTSAKTTSKPLEPRAQTILTNSESRIPRGSRDGRISESERRRAETLHDRIINSTVDMVTAEMEIWGDPYFIPNYQASGGPEDRSSAFVSSDGTMRYIKDEISIVINFRTPLDYQITGFVMNFPELVKPFSGLFNVWAVTNVFAAGKFTQTLKLIRRQGQSNDTGPRSIIVPAQTTEEIQARLDNIARGIRQGF